MKSYPFSHLTANAHRTIHMNKGDVLFRQNQPTSGLYRVADEFAFIVNGNFSGVEFTASAVQF